MGAPTPKSSSVPQELQGLSYAESVMIAKIRHNRCVIRVNSGRVGIHANAIILPSRDEMREILAFVFTGSTAPTQEDFDCTPMLVRRDKVAAALNWLKLNHEGYADLETSEENLLSYKHRYIPVVIDYRKTTSEPHNSIPMVAWSMDDSNEEHRTSEGQCSFAVHGLTGAEYSDASM
ncbi:hypothetical protein B0H10DRAFT_2165858 [Mycena sp. CBHHK59/15]|nr:hypothetical protein B0H10DRAFT_2165858 [Mycena sp. CBHHK59/15]